MPSPMSARAGRRDAGEDETRAANRAWWDAEADEYHAEHGEFLGDSGFVWGPEGWTEDELDLLGVRDGMTVLEIGAGGAAPLLSCVQQSRYFSNRPKREMLCCVFLYRTSAK